MIRTKINTKDLEKLVRDLKRMRFDLLRETSEMIIDLSKSLNESYTKSIDELVYSQYEPEIYQRTGHLQGGHGARVEVSNVAGDNKSYSFYINEESRDPVDGTTWGEKADKIEKGATEMSVGFNRPFIDDTQNALVWETDRLTNALIRKYEQVIRNVGG
ncbi:hypothetical protein [Microcystis phage MaeS]|nr:hypothetical protein [Microcystis phage MaeS]